jgi:hypothetical protein
MSIKVDPEFKTLIPPLTAEERAGLEESILREGCRDPLVVWASPDGEQILLDGHNRLEICTTHRLPYKTEVLTMETRDDAKVWIIKTQFARRNLTPYQRAELFIVLGEIIAARSRQGERSDLCPTLDKGEPLDTIGELAELAGMSRASMHKARVIHREAPEEVKAKLRRGETTINKEFQQIRREARREDARERAAEQIRTGAGQAKITVCSSDDWIETLPVGGCDLLLTDPPYITDIDVEDFGAFVRGWLPRAWARIKPSGRGYVFCGAYPEEIRTYLNVAAEHKIPVRQLLVWTYRNTMGPKPKQNYFLNYQSIIYIGGPDVGDLDCPMLTELCASQEANHPARSAERVYQWQKPDSLAEAYIRHSTTEGETILDPFAGSGTFLLAAARLGRIGIGCEISREVAEIAKSRGCLLE